MADRYVATSATPGTDVDGLGGGAVAAGDITDAGDKGVAFVQADDLDGIADALSTAEDMSGDGWSTLAGSGTNTSTWSSGKLTMTLGSGGAASGGVSHTTLRPRALSGGAVMRIDVITGDGGSQRQVYLATGKSASNGPAIAVYGNGDIVASVTVGGVYSSLATASTAVDSGQRTGGQLWAGILQTATGLAWIYGLGSGGALPTEWTVVHTTTTPATVSVAAGRFVQVGVVTDTGIAWAVDVLAIEALLPGAV